MATPKRKPVHAALIDSLVIAFREWTAAPIQMGAGLDCEALCDLVSRTELTPEQAQEILKRVQDVAFVLSPFPHESIASAHARLVADLESRR